MSLFALYRRGYKLIAEVIISFCVWDLEEAVKRITDDMGLYLPI